MTAKPILRLAIPALLLALAVAASLYWYHTARWLESTNNAYIRADIAAITPRIGGEIIQIKVAENQAVQQGDVLLRIDPRDYQARLAQTQAEQAQAQAALIANQRGQAMQAARVEEARATIQAAQAQQQRAEKDYQRAKELQRSGSGTQAELDQATASIATARAQLARSRAGLVVAQRQQDSTRAQHDRLQAQLKAAQAAVQLAQLDLDATTLRAPSAGFVGDLAINPGERARPGRRLLSLVSTQIWVEANFKETQLRHIQTGQNAEIEVDAFSGDTLQAQVASLSPAAGSEFALLPANNATGNFTKIVQRVPVRIRLKLAQQWRDKLRPGMSVTATVHTKPTPNS